LHEFIISCKWTHLGILQEIKIDLNVMYKCILQENYNIYNLQKLQKLPIQIIEAKYEES